MKITYKYLRNNAQFLYDLSCTPNIDQLIRRLTGRQIVTNNNGEKEHVDPAFDVDEILINDVEIFNRAEQEAVYDSVDKLRAPWDGTENKDLSEEDAKQRNADLSKAVSLLKAYNNRFVELDKYLSLLPAEVRKIPNEFMSIGVNGFYRTVSISLGLKEYLDEISTDREAFKVFNTAEEQNQALFNVMNLIDFLSKLGEDDEDEQTTPTEGGQSEASKDEQNTPVEGSQPDDGKGKQTTSTEGGQSEDGKDEQTTLADGGQTEEGKDEQTTPAEGSQPDDGKGQQNPSVEGGQSDTGKDEQNPSTEGSQSEESKGKQTASDEGGQTEPSEDKQTPPAEPVKDQQNTPTGEGQSENGAQDNALAGNQPTAPTGDTKLAQNGDQHKDAPTGDNKKESTDNPQKKLTGTALIDDELSKNVSELLHGNK